MLGPNQLHEFQLEDSWYIDFHHKIEEFLKGSYFSVWPVENCTVVDLLLLALLPLPLETLLGKNTLAVHQGRPQVQWNHLRCQVETPRKYQSSKPNTGLRFYRNLACGTHSSVCSAAPWLNCNFNCYSSLLSKSPIQSQSVTHISNMIKKQLGLSTLGPSDLVQSLS